ncbi:hypothetical protein GCM10009608_08580 [Pseudonocardia alaniniphila]
MYIIDPEEREIARVTRPPGVSPAAARPPVVQWFPVGGRHGRGVLVHVLFLQPRGASERGGGVLLPIISRADLDPEPF